MGKHSCRFLVPALAVVVCLILGCQPESGAKKALKDVALAMENNNPSAFMSFIDMQAFTANYDSSLSRDNALFNSLNELSQSLGLGNLGSLFGNLLDNRARITQSFERGVASGELMAQCRQATTPDCPWVPQSLRDAQVVELSPTAAIAKVTTPARLTSWLAMAKKNGDWLIVGQAVMENNAKNMAINAASGNLQPAAQDSSAVDI